MSHEMKRPLPAWRSLMFCPANSERFIAKAHTRGADAIILDLEDSVAAGEKSNARLGLQSAAKLVGQSGADVLVRINREIDLAVEDIAAAVSMDVMGLVLPKVKGPEHIQLLSELVLAKEIDRGIPAGQTCFVVLVETVAALEVLNSIARADPRVIALAIGGEDFATDIDALPSVDSLYVAKMQGLYAARAAQILPLGVLGSVAGVQDLEAYEALLKRSRELGFACASCVHPSHVPILNSVFSPSAADLARAEQLIAAYEEGVRAGKGAILFDGKMVDKPVVARARRLLERALHK